MPYIPGLENLSFTDGAKNAFSCGREVLRAGGVKRGEGRLLPGGGHEKGPIPAAVREGRGLSGASPGCADVACRCLGVKGGERIAAPRSEGSALHRRTSGECCVVSPALAVVSFPGDGEDHSVSCGFCSGNLDGVRMPWNRDHLPGRFEGVRLLSRAGGGKF